MKRVYSHPSLSFVHNVKNVLDNHGIASRVQGDRLADASGGLAPTDVWVELWLLDESRFTEAKKIVDGLLNDASEPTAETKSASWTCPNCGEEIEPAFAACWNCETDRPGDAQS